MIELVGHTLVNGAINLDIDIVADMEGAKVSGDWDRTLSSEGSCEEIPCSRSEPVSSRHFLSSPLLLSLSPCGNPSLLLR